MVEKVSKNYKIPFHKNGTGMLRYAWENSHRSWDTEVEWRENHAFKDTITFMGMSRGQSAAYFIAKSDQYGKVFISMRDMLDIVSYGEISGGKITGTFTFTKRGQNYGIALLHKDKNKVNIHPDNLEIKNKKSYL